MMVQPTGFLFFQSRRGDDPEIQWSKIAAWVQETPNEFPRLYTDPQNAMTLHDVRVPSSFVAAYEKYLKALEQPRLEDVLVDLDTALQINDSFPTALNAYGATCYLLNRNAVQAEKRLRQAVQLRPKYRLAWVNLARVLERKRDFKGAAQATAEARALTLAGDE